jgi:hypothetical protein
VLSTGLTGVTGLTCTGHRFDRCSTGSKPCKFSLCVLVCFGSEGCLLVPRSSGYVGLANLGSESETCVGSRVRLVGVSISFEKNFYWLHSFPPLWFAVSVLQVLSAKCFHLSPYPSDVNPQILIVVSKFCTNTLVSA